MKKLTKLINTQFHPTLYSYGLGGRVILDPGGFIPLETDKLLAWGQGQVNKANAMKGGSPNINGQAIGQAGNIIGGTIDAIAASKNTKPYAKKSLAGGAVKGAAQGASAGLMFGPVGAAIGGVVGAGAGLLTSKLGNDASRNAYINETLEQQKQQTIANLPGQPEYISTFARGGKLYHNKPPVLRQSALELGNGGIANNYPNKTSKGKLIKGADGKALLDKNGNPVYMPDAGVAELTSSPIDAAVLGATSVGPQALRWLGSNIIGNTMADFTSELPEGVVSGAGLVKSKMSEDLKRIGGFNDLKQAKQHWKNGNYWKAVGNTFTGGAGIYDSNLTRTRVDDFFDKMIEKSNAAVDGFDTLKGLRELKANGGEITDRVSSFDTGGLHSENGGIPIGQNAMVEKGEYMYKTKSGQKYIFSNKF